MLGGDGAQTGAEAGKAVGGYGEGEGVEGVVGLGEVELGVDYVGGEGKTKGWGSEEVEGVRREEDKGVDLQAEFGWKGKERRAVRHDGLDCGVGWSV